MMTIRCGVVTTLAVLVSFAPQVRSQQLEEVVVTAQKREQSLQDVAISVAVISGAELEALNKTQISGLPRSVPGFSFASGTSDAGRSIIVRGIGTQSFSRSVDQSVGTVVDGVASGSVSGSILDFSDVERDHICCIGPLEVVTPGSVADLEGGKRGSRSDSILDNGVSDGSTELNLYSLDINYAPGDYLITSISAYVEEDIFGSARGQELHVSGK